MSNYEIVEFPKTRYLTFDVGIIGGRKHHIAAFVEVDVTDARRLISAEKSKENTKISFTSWFLKCLGDVLEKMKGAHGIQYKKNKIIYFDNVDISMVVEKEINGELVPIPLLMKDVNKKTISDIFKEIETAKNQKIADESDFVLGQKQSRRLMSIFLALPQCLRLIIWKRILKNPFLAKEQMGTVVVTSIGMVGRYPGWILPKSMHTLCIGLGSIVKKPWVVSDEIVVREILHMTVLLDHDVIDGAPASRFVGELISTLESGKGI